MSCSDMQTTPAFRADHACIPTALLCCALAYHVTQLCSEQYARDVMQISSQRLAAFCLLRHATCASRHLHARTGTRGQDWHAAVEAYSFLKAAVHQPVVAAKYVRHRRS